MRHFRPILWAILVSVLLTVPPAAFADAAGDAITKIAGPLELFTGDFGSIYESAMMTFIGIVDAVAIMTIVIAGFSVVHSQDEGQLAKSQKTIVVASLALVLINIVPAVKLAITGFRDGGSTPASLVSVEVLGIVDFFTTIFAVLAVLFIIINGIRAITGNEGAVKTTLLGVASGIVLIGLRVAIANAVTIDGSPVAVISAIAMIVEGVLGFMALIAVGVLVYAGLMMVIGAGRDEMYTKAKSLAFRVLIGLVVILASLALVFLVIDVVHY